MRALLLVLVAMICGCNLDVAERHYKNLDAAKGDTWLPESVLPPSIRDIDERNNLDLDVSSGEFRFAPSDSAVFFNRLSPTTPSKAPFANWEGIVNKYIRDGRTVRYYRDHDTGLDWAFFCAPSRDHCQFDGWSSR